MKKRIIALLMLAVMLVLCACTGKPPAITDDGTKPTPGTQPGDKTTDPVVTTAAPDTTAHADIPDGIDYGDSDSPGRSEPLFIISTRQLAHLYGTKEEALAHLKATFTADYYDKDYFEDKLWFSMGYSLYRMLPKDVRTDCVEQWLNDCEPYLRKIRSELEKALVSPEKREN